MYGFVVIDIRAQPSSGIRGSEFKLRLFGQHLSSYLTHIATLRSKPAISSGAGHKSEADLHWIAADI